MTAASVIISGISYTGYVMSLQVHGSENNGMDANITLSRSNDPISYKLGSTVMISFSERNLYMYITAINLDYNTVNIVACDIVTLLGKLGTTLYRNYYGGYTSGEKRRGGFDPDYGSSGNVYVDVPPEAVLTTGSVEYAVNQDLEYAAGSDLQYLLEGNILETKFASSDLDWIRSVSFTIRNPNNGAYSGYCELVVNEAVIATTSYDVDSIGGDVVVTLLPSVPIECMTAGDITVRIYLLTKSSSASVRVKISSTTGTDDYTSVNGSTTYANHAIEANLEGNIYEVTTGTKVDAKYYIVSATGLDPTDINESLPDFIGKGRIAYTSGSISVYTVINELLMAYGIVLTGSASGTISEFRAVGGYILDYLKILSDQAESPLTFGSTGYYSINVGPRPAKGGLMIYDGNSPNAQYITKEFSPSKNLKNKSATVLVKSTKSTDDGSGGTTTVPIMIALTADSILDDMRFDLSETKADTTSNSNVLAAKTAYGTLMENLSTDWEGTLVVSGIWQEFFTHGGIGAGITIQNARYGMSAYKARVRECTWNFDDQTTTLIVNNYSVRYSNALKDTDKMALYTSTFAIDNTSTDSFSLQYVRVKHTFSILESGNTMRIKFGNDTYSTAVNCDIILLDGISAALAVATFDTTKGYDNVTKHGVVGIEINGGLIDVPEYVRPDKRRNQTLVVNVQSPYTSPEDNAYYVYFSADGASNVPSQLSATSPNTSYIFTIPSNVPTKDGYSFSAWYENEAFTGTAYSPGSSYTIVNTGPITVKTLYAKFVVLDLHTLSYSVNGGSGTVPSPTQYSTGAVVTVTSATCIKTGYVFVGWSTLPTATSPQYTAGQTFTMPSYNMTLYATYVQGTTVVTLFAQGSGTYTVPASVQHIKAWLVGAGGGAGGAAGQANYHRGGGGGGGSGYVTITPDISVTAGQQISWYIGAGGAHGENAYAIGGNVEGTDGTDGEATTFGTYTANGGLGGRGAVVASGVTTPGLGGLGGNDGGDGGKNGTSDGTEVRGEDGEGIYGGSGEIGGGGGGPERYGTIINGVGGNGGDSIETGENNGSYGGGGGGGYKGQDAESTPGDGGSGYIYVEEYRV